MAGKKKRKYTKRNQEYWASKSLGMTHAKSENSDNETFTPELVGDPLVVFEESSASRVSDPTERTSTRSNRITTKGTRDRFANIDEGILPYKYSKEAVGIKDAVVLTQKAYFNVAVFKSTIDLLSEFANTNLYLKGGNAASRKFVNAWMKTIDIDSIKEQGFREYYRSGNVIYYELTGNLTPKSMRQFDINSNAAAMKDAIPVKYILLNPADIVVKEALTFGEFNYAKVLTPFEISRLKERSTPEAKRLFNALPKEVQEQLDQDSISSTNKEILLPLSADLIHPFFYKKQDYEPLSIPMGFCVLDDINKKMELKKVDQAIARSIENVILLVTMGAEKDKGGINYRHIAAMQDIFKNKSVGRVLVSDYTTRAEFVLPDLRKVMGKEKYEVLNKDIEEGLSNILLGESKYSDTEFKLRIFFERLNESRDKFLKFFQAEVNRVCKIANFKSIPKVHFEKKDAITSADLQKLATRMMELGIITPEQGMDTINKGVFPEAEEMSKAQGEYLKEREKGYYLPMVAAQSLFETENEEATEELQKTDPMTKPKGHNQKNTVSNPSGGRPIGTAASTFSVAAIAEVTKEIQKLESHASSFYKKHLKLKELNENQKETVFDLCQSVASSYEMPEWEEKLNEIIKDNSVLLSLSVNNDVLDIAAEHSLDDYSAAILYHSTKIDK